MFSAYSIFSYSSKTGSSFVQNRLTPRPCLTILSPVYIRREESLKQR